MNSNIETSRSEEVISDVSEVPIRAALLALHAVRDLGGDRARVPWVIVIGAPGPGARRAAIAAHLMSTDLSVSSTAHRALVLAVASVRAGMDFWPDFHAGRIKAEDVVILPSAWVGQPESGAWRSTAQPQPRISIWTTAHEDSVMAGMTRLGMCLELTCAVAAEEQLTPDRRDDLIDRVAAECANGTSWSAQLSNSGLLSVRELVSVALEPLVDPGSGATPPDTARKQMLLDAGLTVIALRLPAAEPRIRTMRATVSAMRRYLPSDAPQQLHVELDTGEQLAAASQTLWGPEFAARCFAWVRRVTEFPDVQAAANQYAAKLAARRS